MAQYMGCLKNSKGPWMHIVLTSYPCSTGVPILTRYLMLRDREDFRMGSSQLLIRPLLQQNGLATDHSQYRESPVAPREWYDLSPPVCNGRSKLFCCNPPGAYHARLLYKKPSSRPRSTPAMGNPDEFPRWRLAPPIGKMDGACACEGSNQEEEQFGHVRKLLIARRR